eukprot:g18378.t1
MDTGTKLQPGRLKRLTRAQATRVRRYETNTWPAKDSCEVNFDEALSSIQQRSVALILNRNAKGVNKKVESKLQGIVGPARTFACCSEEDAEHALRKVMDDCECKVVVCGGGDGTVTSLLNMMAKLSLGSAIEWLVKEAVSNERELKSSPTMCVLRLGTGNALAYLTGAQKNYAKDLSDLVDHVEEEEVPEIPTSTICLTAEGLPSDSPDKMHCFFAGLGYDARMLQAALPDEVFHVKVTNLGEDAYSMDPRRGDWAFECKKGQVIYEGETGIVSVGTVPYYGGGFRLFPFAGVRPGYAHLRLSHIHPAAATFNIRPLWQGTYRHSLSVRSLWIVSRFRIRDYKHVHDFLVKDVMVEVDQPTPLHHSGDFMGTASKVRFQVTSDGSTRLVDFFED